VPRSLTNIVELRGIGGLATDRVSTPQPQSFSYTNPSMMESDADRSFSQSTLQASSHQMLLQSNDAAIIQREREIEEIAQGIIELSDLFRDLQTMVIDQGTMLDRIDYNVERMTTDVKGAEKELVVASGYQKGTTKRKIILLLLLLVAGLFILLLIKPKRHDGGGDSA
jgi:syntaxin 16